MRAPLMRASAYCDMLSEFVRKMRLECMWLDGLLVSVIQLFSEVKQYHNIRFNCDSDRVYASECACVLGGPHAGRQECACH